MNETPHVIVRIESAVKLKDSLGKFIAVNKNDRLHPIRKKRGIWPPAVLNLEIAIFVDQDLYRLMAVNFESNTEKEVIRFVLAMVNAVSYSLNFDFTVHEVLLLISFPYFVMLMPTVYQHTKTWLDGFILKLYFKNISVQ